MDNDFKYTTHIIKTFFNEQNINVMKWPAQSPDLNPIEMLWIDVNKHVKKQELKNINELYVRIEEAWCFIPITDGVDAFDLSNLCHAEYARNLQKTKLFCVIKCANTQENKFLLTVIHAASYLAWITTR